MSVILHHLVLEEETVRGKLKIKSSGLLSFSAAFAVGCGIIVVFCPTVLFKTETP